MRWIPSLRSLAIVVWVAWLVLIGLMFGLQAWQVWYPYFLPMTAALVIMVVAGSCLIVGASWRLVRGPGRRRALACVFLSMAPLWFMAAHGTYGFESAFAPSLRLNLPVKMLVPLACSLMDLEARVRYPQWTVGEKVVMLSTPAATAREQVAAMDRHVRQLETRLGRQSRWQSYWARGPLLGFEGEAMFSLCMGSRPGGQVDADGLKTVDRHEIAHTVITSFYSSQSQPPALLVEGWAEANQGTDPTEQVFRVWEEHKRGRDLTLRELTGPDGYWYSFGPAYVQGAPLVNYLLRRFGPERFLALYTTCDFATFAADCHRTLGVTLDELDTDFWADVEQTVAREGPHARSTLARLKLDPGVDPAQWKAFVDEYLVAAERLLAPFEHVNMTTEYQFTSTNNQGKVDRQTQHLRLSRSGKLTRVRVESDSGESAYLAHPKKSFEAHRKTPNDPWEIEDGPERDPDRSYRRSSNAIDNLYLAKPYKMAAMLLEDAEDLNRRVDTTNNVVVAGLERFTEKGRPLVRIRLENPSINGIVDWRTALLVLAVDQLFAAQYYEYVAPGAAKVKVRGDCAYDIHEGIPILRSFQSSATSPDGTISSTQFKVVDRNFEPLPEEEFTLERLLGESAARRMIKPDPHAQEIGTFPRWYQVPLVASLICLVAGLATCFWDRRFTLPTDPDPGS
jgi:hypothetical protein